MQWLIIVVLSSGGALADGSPICISSSWADQTAWEQKSVSEVSNTVVTPYRRPYGLLPALATAAGTANLPVCTCGIGLVPRILSTGMMTLAETGHFVLRLTSPVIDVLHFICGCIGDCFWNQLQNPPPCKLQMLVWGQQTCCWGLRFPFMAIAQLGLPPTFRSSSTKEQSHFGLSPCS